MSQPTTDPDDSAPSLWTRVGGEKHLRKVVDHFVGLVTSDARVNYSRHGRFPLSEPTLARTKAEAFNFISMALGGPYRYTGPLLEEIHRGMGISDAEFDAFAAHFRSALLAYATPPGLVEALVGMIVASRSLVVERK